MSKINSKTTKVGDLELEIRTAQVADAEKLRDFVKQVAVDSKYLLRNSAEEFTRLENNCT